MYVSNSPSLKVGGAGMTLSAWVKPAALSADGDHTIIRKANQSGGSGGYLLQLVGPGILSFVARISARDTFYVTSTNNAVSIGQWTHVAATCDGSTARLYVNGTLIHSQPQTSPIAADDEPLVLGRLSHDSSGNAFNGLIDDTRVYNRGFSAAEVAQLAWRTTFVGRVISGGGAGPIQLQLISAPGRTLVIEASTNLSNWTPIWTNTTDAAGRLNFSEPSTAQQRFYRAVER